jgi:hypothetical protein
LARDISARLVAVKTPKAIKRQAEAGCTHGCTEVTHLFMRVCHDTPSDPEGGAVREIHQAPIGTNDSSGSVPNQKAVISAMPHKAPPAPAAAIAKT